MFREDLLHSSLCLLTLVVPLQALISNWSHPLNALSWNGLSKVILSNYPEVSWDTSN